MKLFVYILLLSRGVSAQLTADPVAGKPPPPPDPSPTVSVSADQPQDPPLFSIDFSNEAAQAELRLERFLKRLHMGNMLFSASIRGGELAPTGELPVTYSILKQSPYAGATVGLERRSKGVFQFKTLADFTLADIRSQKPFSDPGGLAASPASAHPNQQSFSSPWKIISVYVDGGGVFNVTKKITASVFTAFDGFGLMEGSPHINDGMAYGNAGTAWMYHSSSNEVTAVGQLKLEGAYPNSYRNFQYTAVPSEFASVEYSHAFRSSRISVGGEYTAERGDSLWRPYVKLAKKKVSFIAAGDIRNSRNRFLPDVRGAAFRVRTNPWRAVTVSVEGRAEKDYFPSSMPKWDQGVLGQVSFDVGRILHSGTAWRLRNRQPQTFVPADSYAMNARIPDPNFGQVFLNAFKNAPTLKDFEKLLPDQGDDVIIAAASSMGRLLSLPQFYNSNEPNPPNVQNAERLYERVRASYISGKPDPVLVCMGEAQIAAVLANGLSALGGQSIEASAVSVRVPEDANGKTALSSSPGHMVTMFQTKKYGVVFMDWGALTPPKTMDTMQALRVYQALQGIPAVYHDITAGTDGHHVAYLFSSEGELIVKQLTVRHELPTDPVSGLFKGGEIDMDESAAGATVERYKAKMREKAQQAQP